MVLRSSKADECRGRVVKPTRTAGVNPETGKAESTWTYRQERCRHRVSNEDYCWQHREQGGYEREVDHAYAEHTSIW